MKMRLGVATIQNQFQEIETWDPSHLATLYLCPNSHPTMCPLMSYDVGENTALIASHFPLSAMPLKSDGSLGIMEALGRSRCRKAEDGLYYSQTQTNATTNVNILQSHQQPLLQSEKRPSAPKLPYNLPLPAKSNHRSSQYRGVTRHRWTGRYEAHLWDNTCKKQGQTKKGRQVYLGGYDKEEKAARAYDLAALKYWGPSTHTNFALENYQAEMEEMKNMNRQEYVAHLRRKSSGFSRGASMYRGVTRHHQEGRWQARIGRVAGNKDLYLGTFSSEELAAEAYDIAAIRFRGVNAVTNFDVCRYDVERIMGSKSNSLLSGEHAPNKHIHGEARKEMGESTTGIINNNYTNSIHHSSLHHTLVFPTPPHLHTPIINNIALLPSHLPVFAAWTDSSFI